MGFSMKSLDLLVTAVIVSAIVIGLQTVGVVLMSSMLIAPAVAARQWTAGMGSMVILAALSCGRLRRDGRCAERRA